MESLVMTRLVRDDVETVMVEVAVSGATPLTVAGLAVIVKADGWAI
jgi:hypothetical protein